MPEAPAAARCQATRPAVATAIRPAAAALGPAGAEPAAARTPRDSTPPPPASKVASTGRESGRRGKSSMVMGESVGSRVGS